MDSFSVTVTSASISISSCSFPSFTVSTGWESELCLCLIFLLIHQVVERKDWPQELMRLNYWPFTLRLNHWISFTSSVGFMSSTSHLVNKVEQLHFIHLSVSQCHFLHLTVSQFHFLNLRLLWLPFLYYKPRLLMHSPIPSFTRVELSLFFHELNRLKHLIFCPAWPIPLLTAENLSFLSSRLKDSPKGSLSWTTCSVRVLYSRTVNSLTSSSPYLLTHEPSPDFTL